MLWSTDTPIKPYRVVLFMCLLLSIPDLPALFSRLRRDYVARCMFAIVVLGFVCSAVNILLGRGNVEYFYNTLSLTVLGMLLFVLVYSIRDELVLKKAIAGLALGGVASACFACSQYARYGLIGRKVTGFFTNPNHLALVIILILPAMVYLFMKKKSMLIRTLVLMLTIMLVVVTVFTGSRTGTLCIAFYGCVAALYGFRRSAFLLRATACLTCMAPLFVNLSFEMSSDIPYMGRYQLENIKNLSGRSDIADAAMRLGLDTCFLGVGLGQYQHYHRDYVSATAYRTALEYDLGIHSHLLDLLVNYGMVAFFVYLVMVATLLLKIWRNFTGTNRAFLLASFAAFNLFTLTQSCMIIPVFWTYLAMLTRLLSMGKYRMPGRVAEVFAEQQEPICESGR